MEADSGNINYGLNTIKAGLLSKDENVIHTTGRIISKVVNELMKTPNGSKLRDWFEQVNGGYATLCMSLKRTKSTAELISNIILMLS